MTLRTRWASLLVLCTGSCGLLASCSDADSSFGVAGQRAATYGEIVPWEGGEIPVCFVNDGYTSRYDVVTQTLEQGWGAVADINFTFRRTCPFPGKPNAVNVNFVPVNYWYEVGGEAPNSGPSGTNKVFLQVCSPGSSGCSAALFDEAFRFTILHEFGHILQFVHDELRDPLLTCGDTPDPDFDDPTDLTEYDHLDSVMSYCRDQNRDGILDAVDRNHLVTADCDGDGVVEFQIECVKHDMLSALDVVGAEIAYGPRSGDPGVMVRNGFEFGGIQVARSDATIAPEWVGRGALPSVFNDLAWVSGSTTWAGQELPASLLTPEVQSMVTYDFNDPWGRAREGSEPVLVSNAKHTSVLASLL